MAAELILFIRETVRELGERRAVGFLKKFYGWYLRRGGFPRPFVQELVRLESTEEVVERLLIAEPEAADGIGAPRGRAARLRRHRRALADLGVRRRLMRIASSLNRLARRDGTVQLTEEPRSSSGGEVDH